MSQFVPFDEAAERLGIPKDQLNDLREAGKIRAYRDGASWKLKEEEIEKLMSDPSLLDPAATSDLSLEPIDEPIDEPVDERSDASDSILVSDADVGDDLNRPPSTIIGKPGTGKGDSDLELLLDSDVIPTSASDVKLASPTSDVLSGSEGGSHVLGMPTPTPTPSPASKFEDLDELEIDLETESSKILSASEIGTLELEDEGSELKLIDSSIVLSKGDASEGGPADGDAADDDLVLGDGGSDITLSAGDSGINLVDPSDSGLALDDISLELGGSGIEPLDLASPSDVGEERLVLEEEPELEEIGALQAEDGFELTPLGDLTGEESDDSGSQVIALDSEASFEEGVGVLTADVGAAAGLAPAEPAPMDVGAAVGAMGAPATGAATVPDTTFTGWNVAGLILCVMMLSLGGMMVFDLMRNMWSWNEPYSVTSSIMDALSFF